MVSVALFAPAATQAAVAPPIAPNANSVELFMSNPTCENYFSFKIDSTPTNGTTSNGVIVISNATNTSFDWAFHADYLHVYDMAAVIVKGGTDSLIYYYTDEADDSDTNLQSPINTGGNQADISHVEFCFDEKAGTEPTPTPVVTPTPTPSGDVDGETGTPAPSDGGVEGATGTPGVTLPPTDTLGAAGTASTGESWRLIVLAMAGLLAAALLLTPARAKARSDRRR